MDYKMDLWKYTRLTRVLLGDIRPRMLFTKGGQRDKRDEAGDTQIETGDRCDAGGSTLPWSVSDTGKHDT